jgi:glycosyltransferase involved in cell wall biosynthesis
MRILHITNSLSGRGNGIVNLALDIAIEQRAAGHQVAFASGPGDHDLILRRFGIPWFPATFAVSPRTLPASLLRLRTILRQFRPDLVHAHTRAGLLCAWLVTRAPRRPLVAHLHNVHDSNLRVFGLADRVIAVSASVARSLGGSQIPRSRLRVVLNGSIGSRRVPPLHDLLPRPITRPAIVTVAGMYERKGIAELIEAFDRISAEFPQAHLYLVGHGPDRAAFEEKAAASRAADRIHFEGFQSAPQEYLLSADVFVLASRRESFGLAITEAREAGCAIVASDVDGIPEALDDGHAGLLVPPHDPEALAAAIRRLLSDPGLARSLRARAREGAARYSTARMSRDTLRVYAELVPDPSQPEPPGDLPGHLQNYHAVRHL